jgi:hypothetical protein
VDEEEEIEGAAVDLVAEEVVTGEDEEGFREVVVEVSFTSPRSSDSQEIEVLGHKSLLALAQKFLRPKVADRRVRRSRR